MRGFDPLRGLRVGVGGRFTTGDAARLVGVPGAGESLRDCDGGSVGGECGRGVSAFARLGEDDRMGVEGRLPPVRGLRAAARRGTGGGGAEAGDIVTCELAKSTDLRMGVWGVTLSKDLRGVSGET